MLLILILFNKVVAVAYEAAMKELFAKVPHSADHSAARGRALSSALHHDLLPRMDAGMKSLRTVASKPLSFRPLPRPSRKCVSPPSTSLSGCESRFMMLLKKTNLVYHTVVLDAFNPVNPQPATLLRPILLSENIEALSYQIL